jgi:hypothetical protein
VNKSSGNAIPVATMFSSTLTADDVPGIGSTIDTDRCSIGGLRSYKAGRLRRRSQS